MTCTPIVFLIFNRPLETMRVFDKIREVRPEKLLVVADGPRSSRPGEAALCRQTRAVLDRVDWPCQVLTDFADTNMGCARRIASGLEWAFEEVEEAIIVEDDCLPDPSFFPYCDELLERYRSDERIMMISGNNFQNGASRTSDSYYFSHLPQIWGWATWRRAWRHFDFAMSDWPQRRDSGWIKAVAKNPELDRRWRQYFDYVVAGKIDTWAYRWMYCVLARNGLSIVPDVNLVTNIGFGPAATHTFVPDERYVVPSRAMEFPLRHSTTVKPCHEADEFEKVYLHRLTLLHRIYLRLRPMVGLVRPVLERTGLWARLRAAVVRLRV